MSTNQIVPFATGAGAEVVDPVTYAAEGYIQQGFQAGILQPYDLNTVLRQSSFVAATIAQFIADHQAGAVNDDGNVTKLENQFLAALLSAVEAEATVYVVDGGTTDALVGAPSPALTAYTAGQVIAVKKNASVGANTTATPTIALNGLGTVTITKSSGSPLYAGDLPQGSIFVCVYDGTYFRHIGLTSSTAALMVQAGAAVVFTASGTNAYTGTLAPAPTALTPRMEVLGAFATANTSAAAPTLLLNGIGVALPIVKQGGGVPAAGDLAGFVPLILNTAGTAWIINGLVPSDVLALIATNASVIRVTDTASASTAQTLVGTASPAVSAYSTSQVYIVTAKATNAAAAPTLAVTGAGGTSLGTLNIVKRDGSAVAAGDIPAGATIIGSPDGSGNFRMFGLLPSDIAASPAIVKAGTINPQSASSSQALSPTSGSNYTRTLTFTAPSAGVVTAIATWFPANNPTPTDSSGNGVRLTASIVASPSGNSGGGSGSSTLTIIAQGSCSVAKGDTVTVTSTANMPNTSTAFPGCQIGISYTFLPQA